MSAVPLWASANGANLFDATIRAVPSDFVVTEKCDIEFSGEGEHDFLWIEKIGTNTHWVAECLAKHGNVPLRDVGYAGLKDRHAITRQWFSVRRLGTVDWNEFSEDGVEILEQQRHRRKLRRGAHSSNAFKIALRSEGLDACAAEVDDRLKIIAKDGVPNYFGEQRFGRGGSNIELCKSMFAGRRLSRAKRGIALSAARSLIFNTILEQRVVQGSWNKILAGELANLDGSGSVFVVDDVDDELIRRCDEQDIHPSGSLWGDGSPRCTGVVAELEAAAADNHADIVAGLIAARMEPASRALRLLVTDLSWKIERDVLWLEFALAKGGYATVVLREVARCGTSSF
jgi:tRNA pseudouridine13 synthase